MNYFSGVLNAENYFTVVYSDLENTYDVKHIVHRNAGISDNIERINYAPFSRASDVVRGICGGWKPLVNQISNRYINIQQEVQHLALTMLQSGFTVELGFDKGVIQSLLIELENRCVSREVINHEEV